MNCFGETVQDSVEKALNKIQEQLSTLERRGRSESIKEAEVSLHTLEPASMTRQVCVCLPAVEYGGKIVCIISTRSNSSDFRKVNHIWFMQLVARQLPTIITPCTCARGKVLIDLSICCCR